MAGKDGIIEMNFQRQDRAICLGFFIKEFMEQAKFKML
jgi:hypothetical protein